MDFDVNLVAVLVAAVAGMAVGAAWYSPMLFGKAWMKHSGVTDEDMAKAKAKGMGKSYALNFVAMVVMAYVLSYFVSLASVASVSGAFQLGFWLWLGFVATLMLNAVLWENKPWKLYAINVSYPLVAVVVMVIILMLF